MALASSTATASFLQLMHTGGCDGALAGNAIPAPCDGASTMLLNAAGVVGRPEELLIGTELINVSGRYTNPASGFDEKSTETPYMPVLWGATDRMAPWYFGAGLYGSIGAAFNFNGDPDAGIPTRLLGELGIMQIGIVAGREVIPGLRVGAQIAPTMGTVKARYPSPLGAVRLDLMGWGISGTLGALYDVDELTTLGLEYRAPGIIFMMDDDASVGLQGDEADVDFQTPQSVGIGVARKLTQRLRVTLQTNWTHYSEFENTKVEFDQNEALNQRIISDARSTFRYGVGLQYELTELSRLRIGMSRESWMMEDSALTPLLYDTADTMLMLGGETESGPWVFTVNVGGDWMEDRTVSSADNPRFPGTYKFKADIGGGATITYRFNRGA
jgi:long-subunit fatty acid transport protein